MGILYDHINIKGHQSEDYDHEDYDCEDYDHEDYDREVDYVCVVDQVLYYHIIFAYLDFLLITF